MPMPSLRDANFGFDLNPVQQSVANEFNASSADSFQRGWQTSVLGENLNHYLTEAAKAEAAGRPDLSAEYLGYADQMKRRATPWAPTVSRLEDINDLSDLGSWAAQGLASGLHSTLPSIAGGLAGAGVAGLAAARLPLAVSLGLRGPASAAESMGAMLARGRLALAMGGAMVPGYNMEMEEAVGQAMQDPTIRENQSTQDILDAGRVKGAINMIPEALLGGGLAGKVTGNGLARAIASPGEILTTAARGIPKGMLLEGGTEGIQNIVGQMTQQKLRGSPDLEDAFNKVNWMDVANDAAVGGLAGGGIGAVGGVADAAYGTVAGIAQNGYNAATSDTAKRLLDKGVAGAKAVGGVAMDAAKGGDAALRQFADETLRAYDQTGLAGVEDMIMRKASDNMDAAEDMIRDVTDILKINGAEMGKDFAQNLRDKIEKFANSNTPGSRIRERLNQRMQESAGMDMDQAISELTGNPYKDGGDISKDDLSALLNRNGVTSQKIALALQDESDFHNLATDKMKADVKRLAENPSKDPNDAARVAYIWEVLSKKDKAHKDLDGLISQFQKAQKDTGNALPSKQLTEDAKNRRDQVKMMLESMGIDTVTVNRLSELAGKGDNNLFNTAVSREMMSKRGFKDDDLQVLRELGRAPEEEFVAPKNRKARRAETAQAAAQQGQKEGRSLLTTINGYVAESVAGTDYDDATTKRMMTHMFGSMVDAVANGTMTQGQLMEVRRNAEKVLGEKGRELVDIISDVAGKYSEWSGRTEAQQKLAAMREQLDGKESAALTTIDTMLHGKDSTKSAGERRATSRNVLSELTNAYLDGMNGADDSARRQAKREAEVRAAELEDAGDFKKARAVREKAKEQLFSDPFAAYHEAVKKHFGTKSQERVEAVVRSRVKDIRGAVGKAIYGERGSGTGQVSEREDLNDQEFIQSEGERIEGQSLDSQDEELAEKDEQETGTHETFEAEGPRTYGQSAREQGKYKELPGAPLTTRATHEHPRGELSTLRDEVEAKNQMSRANTVSPQEWARQMAESKGMDEGIILDDAAREVIAHDEALLPKLQKALLSSNLSRREGNEMVNDETVRNRINRQIADIRQRLSDFEKFGGSGDLFFSKHGHYRYIQTTPATGEILGVDEKTLTRFMVPEDEVDAKALEWAKKTGGDPQDFKNSIIEVKTATGLTRKIDFAGIVTEMMERNQAADITGVGDKTYDPTKLEMIRVAVANAMTSLYTSDLLAAEDPFFAKDGVQMEARDFEKYSDGVRASVFKFKPGLVVYRKAGEQRVYTAGQVYGVKGETAAKGMRLKAVDQPLTKEDMAGIVQGKSETGALVDATGKRYDFNPKELLRAVMTRFGMNADTILPALDSTNGITAKLAGQLLSDGLALLNQQGFTLRTDKNGLAAVSKLTLWDRQYGDETFPVRWSSVASEIAPRDAYIHPDWLTSNRDIPVGQSGKYRRYSGTYDFHADQAVAARQQLESAIAKFAEARKGSGETFSRAGTVNREELLSAARRLENTIKFNDENLTARDLKKVPNSLKTTGNKVEVGGINQTDTDIREEGSPTQTVLRDGDDGRNTFGGATYASNNTKENNWQGSGNNRAERAKAAVSERKAAEADAAAAEAQQRPYKDTTQQPAITTVSTTPYEEPKLSFTKEIGNMTSEVTATASPTTPESKAKAAIHKLRAERNKLAAELRALRAEKQAQQMTPDMEEAPVAPVPTSKAPSMRATELLERLMEAPRGGGLNTLIQELLPSAPSAAEFNRVANQKWGEYENWPLAARRFSDALEGRGPTPPSGPGGGVKPSMQQTRSEGQSPRDQRLESDVTRRFGDAVNMMLNDIVGDGYSGQYTPSTDKVKGLIEVSLKAVSQRGSLAHESLHALFDMLKDMGPQGRHVMETILAAASKPETIEWLKEQLMLRGETADGKAISEQLLDPEERAAFLFQFYIENDGKMPIPMRGRGIIRAIGRFLKSLAGIQDDLIKAGNFFKFFDEGTFEENMHKPDQVLKGLQETTREQFVNKLGQVVKPLRQLGFQLFGHTIDRIKALNVPEYNEILKRFQDGTNGTAGYMEEQRARMYQFANEYTDIVGGYDPKALPDEVKSKVADFIKRMEAYKKSVGVPYDQHLTAFPKTFNLSAIEGNLEDFKADLRRWGGFTDEDGKPMSVPQSDEIVNQIMLDGYYKGAHDFFEAYPEKMAKYASDDLHKEAFSYIKKTTRAVELKRAFPDGIKALMEAGDNKTTAVGREIIRTYVGAATGEAPMVLSPELRKLYGAVITGINLSVLPFAVFSQMLEPLQLAFRKNDVSSAVGSLWRGLRDLPRTFKAVDASVTKDQWEVMAREMGLVTDMQAISMMSEVMNDVPMRGKMDKINHLFFRYNGMEQWSRSMHIAATANAVNFITRHDTEVSELGDKLLQELGLERGKIPYKDGQIDHTAAPVRSAILRFVNESMAHPDPGTNTVWMNDPRFALVAHLKRFTFGFSYYVNNRAIANLKDGNIRSLLPLAAMVPWMVAVDGFKDFINPGDEAYKNSWTASDYVAKGIERSSLAGRFGLGFDIDHNLAHGGSGIEALSPAAETASKIARGIRKGQGTDAVLDALPVVGW